MKKMDFNDMKPYNDTNTDFFLKKQKMILKNIFFNLMNNCSFSKNVRKHRYQACNNKRKLFRENMLAIEMNSNSHK